VRASYDRAFQTPATESLLLAGSAAFESVNVSVLRLPVQPSLGNFFEIGVSKRLFSAFRVEVAHFRREMSNFADDDLLLNTGVSFPIAFRQADIQGTEVKLELPAGRAIADRSATRTWLATVFYRLPEACCLVRTPQLL